jgi:hypothetical protein
MSLPFLLPAPRQFRLTGDRFYNGGKRENGILSRAYDQVAKHVHTVFKVRQYHSFTPESMLMVRLEYLTGKLAVKETAKAEQAA